MKPSEFMKKYRTSAYFTGIDEFEVDIEEENSKSYDSHEYINLGLFDWSKLDERFEDMEGIVRLDVNTIFGLDKLTVKRMIDFFMKYGYNPENTEDFAMHLERMRLI